MTQVIGNVGMLDLTQATEESVRSIAKIGNIGLVLYRAETAHLLTYLKQAGNIGKTLGIPRGYRYYQGMLRLNKESFKDSGEAAEKVWVNGMMLIEPEVTLEMIEKGLPFAVNGQIYAPRHLAGAVMSLLLKAEGAAAEVLQYDSFPRFEEGKFRLTNAYLASAREPMHLVVDGVLELAEDLDMDQFAAKLECLRINGKVTVREEQSVIFYEKAKTVRGKMEIIPEGFRHVTKLLRLNGRSIRRFKGEKWYTKHPVILDADVSREDFRRAVSEIRSVSIVICSEELEDLVWERCPDLDTEIISYAQSFAFIEGREVWSKDQLLALGQPVQMIVEGTLVLADDVTGEVLKTALKSLDLFGEVLVKDPQLKGVLHGYVRSGNGEIRLEIEEEKPAGIGNIGMLSL